MRSIGPEVVILLLFVIAIIWVSVKASRSRSRWPSVVGWILIVIAVLGGLQALSRGGAPEAVVTMALMIALGLGLIRRWSGKRIAITLASILLIPTVVLVFATSSPIRTNSKSIAELNRMGDQALLTSFRVSGDVADVVRDGVTNHALSPRSSQGIPRRTNRFGEVPRLCRGGSQSLTFPGIWFVAVRPGKRAGPDPNREGVGPT